MKRFSHNKVALRQKTMQHSGSTHIKQRYTTAITIDRHPAAEIFGYQRRTPDLLAAQYPGLSAPQRPSYLTRTATSTL